MKKLAWGETPWDTLTHEELLRETQRMFSALESTRSVLRILNVQDASSTFWGKQGSGGRALDRAEQVAQPLYEKYDQESVYRSFFRYATSLLFEVSEDERWVICPICGGMWSGKSIVRYVGTACAEYPVRVSACPGVFRWLEWSDLAKETSG